MSNGFRKASVVLSSFDTSSQALKSPSLLITDDDRGFRETVAEVLRQRGYRTLLAADGQEAFRIVQAEEIHLVLLDMHMPKWTGLETLRRVRQLRAGLPCILISGGLDDKILAEAQAARVICVLSKPVSCIKVRDTVSAVLQRAYNQRGLHQQQSEPPADDQRLPSDVDWSAPEE